jgi:hypothetical protein
MAFAQELAIDAQASLDAERQARTQAPALTPPATAKRTAEKRHQAQWAIAMVKEAQEISASIPGLPHVERRAALIRAGALSNAANELLTGVAPAAHGPNTREHP